MGTKPGQIAPKDFIARVKCGGCGRWINITGANKEEPCWQCLGKVKFILSGSTPIGFAMPFMTFHWIDTEAEPANY